MSQYQDFDLDRSTAEAWSQFQQRLAEVISVIDNTADLTISTVTARSEDRGPYVSFTAPQAGVVRCEAAANGALDQTFQLTEAQLEQFVALGWQSPDTDETQPVQNFWVEGAQEDSERLSQLTVSALRDIYQVAHPVFLAPDQLAEILQPAAVLDEAALDTEEAVALVPQDTAHLSQLVESELTEFLGYRPLRDAEGDIAIRVGSTMIFVRIAADGKAIAVFSVVVHDVEGRSRATEVLNDLNCESRWVKFQLIRDKVFASLSVPAKPFVPNHLIGAVTVVSDVADGIDNDLAVKLRGRTTFTDEESGGIDLPPAP